MFPRPSRFLPAIEWECISRRRFLSASSRVAAALGGAGLLLSCPRWLRDAASPADIALAADPYGATLLREAPVARYWIAANDPGVPCRSCHTDSAGTVTDSHLHREGLVKCLLCPQGCTLREGERGHCRARLNLSGTLRTLVYGRPISVHVDPIEKKPFYHFLPGSMAFSLATAGCPLRCKFCQNWEISQARSEDYPVEFTPPEAIVAGTLRSRAPVIAFTYNEPTVFTEYLTDIARRARKEDIACVMVSCGFMNEEPLAEICSILSAIKIDLKGINPDFYRRVCGAELAPVLRSIRQVARSGVHLELVNLVVPTLNDADTMLSELVKWVAGELGPDIPVHFTRFHPEYQMLNLPPTPVATLEKAYALARDGGLRYPYVGNVPGHTGDNTYCPACGRAVIERSGFFITAMHIKSGSCEFCREPIAGVWNDTN